MANAEHLEKLKQGVEAWNQWIKGIWLTTSKVGKADLIKADLRHSPLNGANLSWADLSEADLSGAYLRRASLNGANLFFADLTGADLSGADLGMSYLRAADFTGANLSNTNLGMADLTEAVFTEANLSGAVFGSTVFANNDLSTVKGLEAAEHMGPSSIAIDTLFKSNGRIPIAFLRGCGVPEDFITFIPSLLGRAIEFYSCFISYHHKDEEFAKQLHSRMRTEKLRVWYAPEEMKGGKKLHEQIFSAIQIHDKLLVVLSESSMNSEWVMTEIRRAKKVEREEKRRKLFPIRVVDFEALKRWECFDADGGRDLAEEMREYYIPDFSNWRETDAFEAEFKRLLDGLRAEETSNQ